MLWLCLHNVGDDIHFRDLWYDLPCQSYAYAGDIEWKLYLRIDRRSLWEYGSLVSGRSVHGDHHSARGSYNYYFTIGVGGSGGGSGTLGYLAKFGPSTTTVENSHIDDGATTPNILTATEQLTVTSPGCSGCAGWFLTTEGTDPTTQAGGGAGATIWTSDAAGNPMVNAHGTGLDYVCTALDLDGECPSSGGGPTIQTNSSNNSSQSVLNFETSSTNSVGLTITPHNTSGGIEKLEVTGGSYTGNAATATNLASYPTLCAGGQFSQGLSSGSNNCATPSGGGGGGGGSQFFTGSVAGTSPQAYTLVSSVAGGTMYNICSAWTFLTSSGTVTGESMVVTWTSAQTVNTTGTFSVPEFNTSNVVQPTCTTIYAQTGTAITLNLTFSGGGSILTGNYYSTVDTGGGGSYPTPVTVSGTSVAELDLTSCITSTYRDYEIRFSQITWTAGSGVTAFIQFSSDNGSTWDSASNYFYARAFNQMNGGFTGTSTNQNSGGIVPSLSASNTSNSGDIIDTRMTLYFPMNTTATKMGKIQTQLNATPGGPLVFDIDGGWYYTGSAAVNAVRLVTTGTFTGQATCQPLPQ